jgi:hypothetical protein
MRLVNRIPLPAYLSRTNLILARPKWLTRFWSPVDRGAFSDGAGLTTTVMVFYNLVKADNSPTAIIRAKQYDWGYFIGTLGNAATVDVYPAGADAQARGRRTLSTA